MRNTPWIGLAALIAMFVLPFLPAWLFEGPRTVRHWPRRHVCGECDAPWREGHICTPAGHISTPGGAAEPLPPVHGELRRLQPVAGRLAGRRQQAKAISRSPH